MILVVERNITCGLYLLQHKHNKLGMLGGGLGAAVAGAALTGHLNPVKILWQSSWNGNSTNICMNLPACLNVQQFLF